MTHPRFVVLALTLSVACTAASLDGSVTSPPAASTTASQPSASVKPMGKGLGQPHIPVVDLPNHTLTPGVAFAVGAARICVPGYASSVRDVPDSEKAAVYHPLRRRVGAVSARGRSSDLPGDRRLERDTATCGPSRTPADGAPAPRTCWRTGSTNSCVRADSSSSRPATGGERLGGRVPPLRGDVSVPAVPAVPRPSSAASTRRDTRRRPRSTAPTIPEWRNLSPRYLVHFTTFAQASARFPAYHLHRPC